MTADPLLHARALVLHDLTACGACDARVVSLVEEVVAARRWWVEQWPEGAAYVAGQIAQDLQDRMIDEVARWPACPRHDDAERHELHIQPDLGADPHWICDTDGVVVAPLGALPDAFPPVPPQR
ncbi:MAG: hypothetical protein M3P48_03490 [Actinomycetota bacterium]|nr:hypothetical protein [Actinomycetota bacterium]